jgi:transcriptional regulator with XRE-family HTH domain
LERLRRERGVSQRQLADTAGVNSSVVSRAERGENASTETWDKLFRGLGYLLVFDVQELAEECGDVLAEEAERRRQRREAGLWRARLW